MEPEGSFPHSKLPDTCPYSILNQIYPVWITYYTSRIAYTDILLWNSTPVLTSKVPGSKLILEAGYTKRVLS
jgi:hypothetical protein